jgi:hypothetical protein
MIENKVNRVKVPPEKIAEAVDVFMTKLAFRLNEKGDGTFASRHEIQGSVTEEYHELVDALRENSVEEFEKELLDVAVACVFGVACIRNKTIDW